MGLRGEKVGVDWDEDDALCVDNDEEDDDNECEEADDSAVGDF